MIARRGLITVCLMFSTIAFPARFLAAQTAKIWEYSPYEIGVSVLIDDGPLFSAPLGARWQSEILRELNTSGGYAWRLRSNEIPPQLSDDLLRRPASVSGERFHAEGKPSAALDKVFIASVRAHNAGYAITALEYDCRTRMWSVPRERTCGSSAAVTRTAAAALLDAFSPLLRIESVEGSKVSARLRAGMLLEPNSPGGVEKGTVLLPVIRRNARNGEPGPGGIQSPPWTFLLAQERTDDRVQCMVSTGFTASIPTKGSQRLERLALAIRPTGESTVLSVKTRETAKPVARDAKTKPKPEPSRPLVGYEVFARNPNEENSEFVGLTDWRGEIEIPRGSNPLRVFYVRHGGQFLARLPVVPGYMPRAEAKVMDDDKRLQAEAIVKSLQGRVMETEARRQILTLFVKNRLEKGNFEEAKKFQEEFAKLPNRIQLRQELEVQQQALGKADGITGKRIINLFSDGRLLLDKFLDPAESDRLKRTILDAEKKSKTPAAAPMNPAPSAVPTPAPAPAVNAAPATPPAPAPAGS